MTTPIQMRLFIILLTILCFSELNINAQEQKNGWSLGYTGGGYFKTENGFLGVDFRYNLTNKIRLSPSVRKYFRRYGHRGAGADVDFQYVLPVSDSFNLYPFLGASYSYWDYLHKDRKTYNKGEPSFGGNIGLGGEIHVVDDIIVGIEAKYNYTEINKQVMMGIRVGYLFR